MRILVTRPREDAERLAEQLEAKGHAIVIEPIFTIEPMPDTPLDLDGVQALLLTSANGARAFGMRSPRRDLRVFAVGDATADAARALGFSDVESAGGDVADLVDLVRAHARPEDGALLHVAGSAVAGDLAGQLGAAGFDVRRAVLYRAEPIGALSGGTVTALRDRQIDVILFFSPRTARTFVSLARSAGIAGACDEVAVAGLSPAVVEAAQEISWAAVETADVPTEAALLAAVDRLAALHVSGAQERTAAPAAPVEPPPIAATKIPGARAAETPQRRSAPLAAALAIVLALAALGWTAWREFASPRDPATDRLTRLEQRIATVERDVGTRVGAGDQVRAESERRSAALAERIGAVEAAVGPLAGEMKALAARLEQVAQEARGEPDAARLAALTAENRRLGGELARLQEEVVALNASLGERGEQRRGDSLVLALGQLRDALARGAPYAPALTTARTVAADDPAVMPLLATLEQGAAQGIATRADLRVRFDKVASEAVRSERVGKAEGWWRPIAERLSSLANWRRVGDVEGDDAEAVVARAEQRLAVDDLRGAVAEMEKLQGPAAAAAQPWLADARARVAAEGALAQLADHALKPGSSSQ
jgi:uroporphyrinogen-III synthase